MAETDMTARDAWIARVLGVATGSPGAARAKVLPIWAKAREALDTQVALLQAELRRYEDEDLADIAEFGFNGLTDGRNTRLMAALFSYDAGGGADEVEQALDSYADMVDPGSVLADYDANPFGVPVRLRATLKEGLDAVRGGLRAGAAA